MAAVNDCLDTFQIPVLMVMMVFVIVFMVVFMVVMMFMVVFMVVMMFMIVFMVMRMLVAVGAMKIFHIMVVVFVCTV